MIMYFFRLHTFVTWSYLDYTELIWYYLIEIYLTIVVVVDL
jgi:hypothetical protein